MNWYIFFVKTGDELCVKDWLNKTFDRNTVFYRPKENSPREKEWKASIRGKEFVSKLHFRKNSHGFLHLLLNQKEFQNY